MSHLDKRIVGDHPGVLDVHRLARRAARCDFPLLITGETGTGKELLARFIHAHSLRSERCLVTVDCGALSRDVARSELFGHRRGAFTGAVETHPGLVETARGGTLFLDEIGELDDRLQQHLLRLIQEDEFRRVGDLQVRKADVRLVVATHRDLERRVEEGLFRADLFYRLSVISIHLPPLRERRSDIPKLVAHFLNLYRQKGIQKRDFTAEALQQMMAHDWPGNIRELANVVARALVLAEGDWILPEDLPFGTVPQVQVEELYRLPFKEARQENSNQFMQEYLHRALLRWEGNVSRAARESGIGRQYFQLRMAEQGIRAAPYRDGSQKD